jgi:hypothetical protein
VVLETALIAAQERLYAGDLGGAAELLDDVETALDIGVGGGGLDQPSLKARMAILDQVAAQDRAVRRADASAYLSTISPTSTLALETEVENRLRPPFTTYRQEVVRLDVSMDGLSASGVVMVHAELADKIRGEAPTSPDRILGEDGQLFAVTFFRMQEGWLMTGREPADPVLAPVPGTGESSESD